MDYTYIAYKNHPQIYLEKCNLDSGSGLESSGSDLKSSDSASELSDSDDSDSYSGLSNLCLFFSFSLQSIISWNTFFEGAI